eukprot:TRINITY_DN407_c1_g1_i1.p1 TRINITY_DN407_c1_g1~~TRINITY_DN407_c1_g1_i1.p1  ORF type:complete len:1519 (+),score=354.97 TRINITY_DN407_c1_g1_i1:113-4669(+)
MGVPTGSRIALHLILSLLLATFSSGQKQCQLTTSLNGNSISQAFSSSLDQNCDDTTIEIDSNINALQEVIMSGRMGNLTIRSNAGSSFPAPTLSFSSFFAVQLDSITVTSFNVIQVQYIRVLGSTVRKASVVNGPCTHFLADNCAFYNVGGDVSVDALLFTDSSCPAFIFRSQFSCSNTFAIMSQGAVKVESSSFSFSAIYADNLTLTGCQFETDFFVSSPKANISDTVFRNNRASIGSSSIFSTSKGTPVFLKNCLFLNNSARSSDILVDAGHVVIDNCNFTRGTAVGGYIIAANLTATNTHFSYAYNGVNQIANTIVMRNCTVEMNNKLQGSQSTSIIRGVFLDISDSSFKGNTGGVLLNNDAIPFSTGSIKVTNCTFDSNTGQDGTTINALSGSVIAKNSTFINNHSTGFGGAIFGWRIAVTNCTFAGNRADQKGGALFVAESDASKFEAAVVSLTVTSSIFSKNSARQAGAISFSRVTEVLSISNCTFAENFAEAVGGAILTNTLDLKDCKFDRNRAVTAGGGIYSPSPLRFSMSSVSASGNSAASGGYLYISTSNTPVNLSLGNSIMIGNIANQGSGGAIWLGDSFTNLTLRDMSFYSNRAALDGGGISLNPSSMALIFTLERIQSSGNIAGNSGGLLSLGVSFSLIQIDSIYSIGDTATINGGSISLLSARSNLKISITNSMFKDCLSSSIGGGLYIAGLLDSFIMDNNLLVNNTCSTYSGGALAVGVIANTFVIRNSELSRNKAVFQGGALSLQSSSNIQSVLLENVIASNNSAQFGFAFSFSAQVMDLMLRDVSLTFNSGFEGGVQFSGSSDSVSIFNSTFYQNSATFKGSAASFSVVSNRVSVVECNFFQNSALNDGSALSFEGGSIALLNVEKTLLDGNIGGGIRINQNVAHSSIIRDSKFQNNFAIEGAGISVSSSNEGDTLGVQIINSVFESNSATLGGGFSYIGNPVSRNPIPSFNSCSFIRNRASNNGGGAYLVSSSYSLVDRNNLFQNCTFFSNAASGRGGAFWFNTTDSIGILLASSSSFESNSATRGGAISVQLPSNQKRQETSVSSISDSKFYSNSASEFGGAIQIEGTLLLKASEFRGNEATQNGKSISAEKGTLKLSQNSLSGSSQLYLMDSSVESQDAGIEPLIDCGPGKLSVVGGMYSCMNVATNTQSIFVSDTKLIVGVAVGVGGFLIILIVLLVVAFFLFYKRVSTKENNLGMKSMVKNMMLEDVQVGSLIGKGYFGCVYSGVWNGLSVAIKTLVEDEDEESSKKWKEEIKLLRKLNHPNIVRLFGLCHVENKLSMVLEYAENGSVDTYLRRAENADSLSNNDLIIMAYEVAQGMSYLVKRGVIHRDLAARNLLLDSTRHIKISDFGMSREDSFYEAKTKVLPYRWCAPEVIHQGTSSSLSDVWSFGVCVWEIFSLGEVPYGTITNEQVVAMVTEGQRLDQPARCPGLVFGIVKMCWAADPKHRPSFSQICTSFMEHYTSILKPVVHDMEEEIDSGLYLNDGSSTNSDVYNHPK